MTDPERQTTLPQVFDSSYDLSNPLANTEEYCNRLYETTLIAFDNDAFLNRRLLTGESRLILQNPEIIPFIDEALSADDDDSLLAVGDLLSRTFDQDTIDNKLAIITVFSYLKATTAIQARNLRLHGEEAPVDRANALCHLLADGLDARISGEKVTDFLFTGAYLDSRMENLAASFPQQEQDYGAMRARLQLMTKELKSRAFTMAYADAMPGEDDTPIDLETALRDTAQISEAFSAIQAKQQYGLKSGYRAHKFGGSLIFNNPPLASADLSHLDVHPLTHRTKAIAEIVHSNLRSFKHIKPKELIAAEGSLSYNYERIGMITHFYIGPDGELYTGLTLQHPLRDIFLQRGKYEAYRKLQAEILADYFDMTRPAETVHRIRRTIAKSSEAQQPVVDPLDTFRRLVIPRVRAEYDGGPSEVEIINENLETIAEKTTEAHGVRRHSVTWHRRRLPEGWSPSPDALAQAAKLRIQLNDGETLVKSHFRGNAKLGEVAGHQLIERDQQN